MDGRCRTIRFYHRHSFRNFIKIKLFCLAPKKPNGHTHTQGTVFSDQHQKVADYSVSVRKEIVKALLAFSSKSINALINSVMRALPYWICYYRASQLEAGKYTKFKRCIDSIDIMFCIQKGHYKFTSGIRHHNFPITELTMRANRIK